MFPRQFFQQDFSKYIEEQNIITHTYNKDDRSWDCWIVTPKYLFTKDTFLKNKKIGYFSINKFGEKMIRKRNKLK